MDMSLIVRGIQALVLVLSVSLVLMIIRRYAPGSRLRLWVLLAGMAGATYLLMRIFGVPGDSIFAKIALGATILLSSFLLLKILNHVFVDYLLKKHIDFNIPGILINMINVVVMAVIFFVMLNGVFGFKLTGFLVSSTVLAAVIGLSLQDILGNFFAGLALQMERPYKVGEWIRVGSEEGIVIQMNWRTLTIRTRAGDHLTIPNASVSKDLVINYCRPNKEHMCRIDVGLSYGDRPEHAKGVIMDCLRNVEGILEIPPPKVFVKSFDDHSIGYDIRFWLSEYYRKPELENIVRTRLWYALKRSGMSVPFPIRDLNVREVSDRQGEMAREEMEREIVLELRDIELFRPLSDRQIESLAESASKRVYTSGEELVRQGETGDSLFIISSGSVEIYVTDNLGGKSHIADMGPGDYFGEMSLLTGEPRSASVSAKTETEVIIVDKSGMKELLETESSVLEPLSAILEKRLEDLSGIELDKRKAEDERKTAEPDRREHLLHRIRDFFGIR